MRKIIVAEAQGFCWGVRRALNIVDEFSSVSILGDLIHNKQVVQELELKNKKVIYEVAGDEKTPIVITAHGTTEKQLENLDRLKMDVVDTTCPLVSAIYKAGTALESEGYQIIIIGDKEHIEVKGIASRMKNPIILNHEDDLDEVTFPQKVGVICQSTFSQNKFEIMVEGIRSRVDEIKIKNTICAPTKNRQSAAEKLAQTVDIMIVIGGFHSSNTKKLVELSQQHVETYHIETKEDVNQVWFKNKQEIGIIAGASTPDWIIEDVSQAIRTLN